MTSFTNFASPEAEIAAVQKLLKRAQRLETPCGQDVMVWHVWKSEQRWTVATGLPPLVLFHRGSGSSMHCIANTSALRRSGREVYVPDVPGFGESAAPLGGGDADVLPEPVEQGLRALLGARRCDSAAFSFGAMVAGLFCHAVSGACVAAAAGRRARPGHGPAAAAGLPPDCRRSYGPGGSWRPIPRARRCNATISAR